PGVVESAGRKFADPRERPGDGRVFGMDKKDNTRAVITLKQGRLPEAVSGCVAIMAKQGDIFSRGGALVRLIRLRELRAQGLQLATDKVNIDRDKFSMQPVIIEVTAD